MGEHINFSGWMLMMTMAFFTPSGESIEAATNVDIQTQSEAHCNRLQRSLYLGGYTIWNAQVVDDGQPNAVGKVQQTANRGKHNGLDIHMTGRCAYWANGTDTTYDVGYELRGGREYPKPNPNMRGSR